MADQILDPSKLLCNSLGLPQPSIPSSPNQITACGTRNPGQMCASGQCCSEEGFCGPIPVAPGIYIENGVPMTANEAQLLYCLRTQGDWRGWTAIGQCSSIGITYPWDPTKRPTRSPVVQSPTPATTPATESVAQVGSGPDENYELPTEVVISISVVAGIALFAVVSVMLWWCWSRKAYTLKNQPPSPHKARVKKKKNQNDTEPIANIYRPFKQSTRSPSISAIRSPSIAPYPFNASFRPSGPRQQSPLYPPPPQFIPYENQRAYASQVSLIDRPPQFATRHCPVNHPSITRRGQIKSISMSNLHHHAGYAASTLPSFILPVSTTYDQDLQQGTFQPWVRGKTMYTMSHSFLETINADFVLEYPVTADGVSGIEEICVPESYEEHDQIPTTNQINDTGGVQHDAIVSRLSREESLHPSSRPLTRTTTDNVPIQVHQQQQPKLLLPRFTTALCTNQPGQGTRTARQSFKATEPDELCVNVGDKVLVLQVYSDAWALGVNQTVGGVSGVFPLCICDPMSLSDFVVIALLEDLAALPVTCALKPVQ